MSSVDVAILLLCAIGICGLLLLVVSLVGKFADEREKALDPDDANEAIAEIEADDLRGNIRQRKKVGKEEKYRLKVEARKEALRLKKEGLNGGDFKRSLDCADDQEIDIYLPPKSALQCLNDDFNVLFRGSIGRNNKLVSFDDFVKRFEEEMKQTQVKGIFGVLFCS